MIFLLAFFLTFIGCLIFVPVLTALGKFFCLFAIVQECEAQVFLLFGRVIGVIDEPGLHFLPIKLGPHSLLIRFFGAVRRVDLRLDQEYLRSEPVNSEEGTPMGIGVWYEMRVGNPADYLFRNTDPRGSLRANVRNASGSLPEQHAPAESPRGPARDEPPCSRGGVAKIRSLGIPSRLGLHSQGALSRRAR